MSDAIREAGVITRDSAGTFDVLLHDNTTVKAPAGCLKMGKRDPDAFRKGTLVQYKLIGGRQWLNGKVLAVNEDGTYDIKGRDEELIESVKPSLVRMTIAAKERSLARAEKISSSKERAREVNTNHLWRSTFATSSASSAAQQGTFGRSDGGEGGSGGGRR